MSDTEGHEDSPQGWSSSPSVLDAIFVGAGPSPNIAEAICSQAASPQGRASSKARVDSIRMSSPNRGQGSSGRARSAESCFQPSRLFGQLEMNEDQDLYLRNFKKDSRNMVTAEFSMKYVENMCEKFKHQLSEKTILDHFYLVLPDKSLQDRQRLRDTPGMKLRQVYGNAKSQKYLRRELLTICADMESEVKDVLNRTHINLSRTESSSI